jgi:hypothetical protein
MPSTRKKPKASAAASSRIHHLAYMLVSVLHYDKSELRSLVESRLKPQLIRYLELGLGRPITGEDAYRLHVGLDPDLDPLTFVYAGILRLCVECEDQHYSDGSCKELINYVLVAAHPRFADTIRKEHRYVRRGGSAAAGKAKASATDESVLAFWDKLSMPRRNRATKISVMTKIPVRTVRDSIKRLRAAAKIK